MTASVQPARRDSSPARRWAVAGFAIALAIGGLSILRNQAAAEGAREIPAPASEVLPAKPDMPMEVAVIAGGCFWGVQGIYQHINGVISAESGYAGGERSTANYIAVTRGSTGHAEAVKIVYDPSRISYGRILQIFFSVAHDPTQLNRQGPDIGTQYRSAIFPLNAEQGKIAREYIAQLNQARIFPAAIVTKIESEKPFYPAEDYHQDFMFKNPTHPYIVVHDQPKIVDLMRLFPDRFRSEPALVTAAKK